MKIDLTGQKFHRLKVICKADKHNRDAVRWLCLCECGRETTATTNELRSGHKKSCGCLKKEPNAENLKGIRFGKLTVIKRIGINAFRKAMWRCKCDCGKMTDVSSSDLKSGNTKSCGCLHKNYAKQNLVKGGFWNE